MWRRWSLIRQMKLNLIRFLRLRGTPDEIAKGFALGVFIGMTPTFGVQMILAVFAAILLKENKIAAVIGVWITNPLTAPFIYAAEYEVGRLLLGSDRPQLIRHFSPETITKFGWDVLLPLSCGSVLLGVLCAVLAYALALRFIPVAKNWRIPRWPRRER